MKSHSATAEDIREFAFMNIFLEYLIFSTFAKVWHCFLMFPSMWSYEIVRFNDRTQ